MNGWTMAVRPEPLTFGPDLFFRGRSALEIGAFGKLAPKRAPNDGRRGAILAHGHPIPEVLTAQAHLEIAS